MGINPTSILQGGFILTMRNVNKELKILTTIGANVLY